MKIKLLSDNDTHRLESIVNSFIKDKTVIDIKYAAYDGFAHRCLVMYEDKVNKIPNSNNTLADFVYTNSSY